MIRGRRGGSLGPSIWLFIACLFYLLPVIIMKNYVGDWAWLTGAVFWIIAAVVIGFAARLGKEQRKE